MSTAAATHPVDAAGAAVPIMLTELRLPTIKRLWAEMAAQSNREGWTAERLLHTLLGHEMPVQLPEPAAPAGEIRIEVRRGATTVTVAWPMAAASECACWMRELLR